jgi:hypothetical protein
MKPDDFWRIVRKCWPLFGGAWCAWLVVQRLLGVSINGDTFGGVAYWIFGLFFAIIFFLAGAAVAALLGRMVEWLMRRAGAGVAAAVVVATLANALAIWQIGAFVQVTTPGLRAPVTVKPKLEGSSGEPSRASQDSRYKTCRDPRPVDAREAAAWDSECR